MCEYECVGVNTVTYIIGDVKYYDHDYDEE